MAKKINKKQEDFENSIDKPIPQHLGKVIEENQLEYSHLVITGRAIPNLYDGLKPVNRRILNTFKHENLLNKHIKSAKLVGACIGAFHPHGDMAVYGALVEMTQIFKNRFPLTNGQGNWGNIQGDSEAANRYCVTGETLINTNKGLEKIKDLVKSDLNTTNPLKRKVFSLGKKINKAVAFFNSGYQDIYELNTHDGYSIKGSFNHPVLTLTTDYQGKPIYKWKTLLNIKENDYIVIDRNDKEKFYEKIKIKKNEKDLALIFGCLVSEGSISNNRISFVNTDKEYYDNFILAWEKVFDTSYYSYERILPSGKTIYEFDVQKNKKNKNIFLNKHIKELINKKAKDKFVPTFILKHNLEIKKIFLSNLFEGDGSFHIRTGKKKGALLNYNSISKQLIKEIQIILLDFGIYSFISEDNRGKNICYRLSINSFDNQLLFKNKISFSSLKKERFEKEMEKLEIHFNNNSIYTHSGDFIPFLNEYIRKFSISSKLERMNFDRYNKVKRKYKTIINELNKLKNSKEILETFNNLIENNFYYTKVKSIKKLKEKEIVYSIRVDSDCHSFIGNGFVNHNTEIRLNSDIVDILFQNIEKDGVTSWIPNYDGTLEEPRILPTKYPVALINGTFGIGYAGITTRVPSYNIKELTNLYIYLIENKFWKDTFNVEDHKKKILKIIPNVDLATGTNIYFDEKEKQKQEDILFSSEFSFRMRASYNINEKERTITFKNIPTEVMTERLVEEIKDAGLSYRLDKNKKQIPKSPSEILNIIENADVLSISSFDDKNYNNDAELTLTFKKGSNLDVELIKAFKYTSLDSAFNAKMRFINEDNQPIMVSLFEHSIKFLKFRLHTFFKAFQFDLKKLKNQLHLLYGLKEIQNDLDTFIDIVRNNEDNLLYEKIKEKFNLDDIQIEHLLNIQLRRLSKTSIDKVVNDINEKETKLIDLENKISTKENLYNVVKEDYIEQLNKPYIKNKKTKRITKIIEAKKDIDPADLIVDKDVIVMYMEDDSIAYVEKNKFRLKNKGTKTTENKINNDFELKLKISESCKLKDTLLLMTNKGKVFKLKTYMFTEQFRYIGNMINLDKDEKIVNILKFNEEDKFYMITTQNGKIKGVKADLFKNTTSNRAIKSITLKDNDIVVSFLPYQNNLTEEDFLKEYNKKSNEKVILLMNDGQIIKYPTSEVSVIAGSGQGSKACTLGKEQKVLKTFIFNETNKTIIVGISNIGRGKKTLTSKITDKHRTNKTNLFFENNEQNGKMICGEVFADSENEALMTLTEKADVSLTRLNGFNPVSRTAKGSIILLKMSNSEHIKNCKKIKLEDMSDSQVQILQNVTEE